MQGFENGVRVFNNNDKLKRQKGETIEMLVFVSLPNLNVLERQIGIARPRKDVVMQFDAIFNVSYAFFPVVAIRGH